MHEDGSQLAEGHRGSHSYVSVHACKNLKCIGLPPFKGGHSHWDGSRPGIRGDELLVPSELDAFVAFKDAKALKHRTRALEGAIRFTNVTSKKFFPPHLPTDLISALVMLAVGAS